MKIDSFEDLAKSLRGFETWDNRGGYDFTGMVYLLGACLDNLRTHATPVELDELPGLLEKHQLDFVTRLITKKSDGNVL